LNFKSKEFGIVLIIIGIGFGIWSAFLLLNHVAEYVEGSGIFRGLLALGFVSFILIISGAGYIFRYR